jgi:glutamate formiminotransferase
VRAVLAANGVCIHDVSSDVDHGRTVTAFSGEFVRVAAAMDTLAERLLPEIDLAIASGVHPRIGALDVVPFVSPNADPNLVAHVDKWAERFASRWEIPMIRYADSSVNRRRLPDVRKSVPGIPDFGPTGSHPTWGRTVFGVRGFLIAANVILASPDVEIAKRIARRIRYARDAGDADWVGVRALGFPLPSRGHTQVSLNITEPDAVDIAECFRNIERMAGEAGAEVAGRELVGVIRPQDLVACARLNPRAEQVVPEFGPGFRPVP